MLYGKQELIIGRSNIVKVKRKSKIIKQSFLLKNKSINNNPQLY